jgi:hypothetical protein
VLTWSLRVLPLSQYGTLPTSVILAGAAPGFVALFRAAIKKGQAEAEED